MDTALYNKNIFFFISSWGVYSLTWNKSAICRNNSIRISALNFPDPRTTERVTFSFDCSQLHLEDIAMVKKDRDEELEAERSTISKLKMMGRDLIANHEHQVAQLEGETLPSTLG